VSILAIEKENIEIKKKGLSIEERALDGTNYESVTATWKITINPKAIPKERRKRIT